MSVFYLFFLSGFQNQGAECESGHVYYQEDVVPWICREFELSSLVNFDFFHSHRLWFSSVKMGLYFQNGWITKKDGFLTKVPKKNFRTFSEGIRI